MPSARYVVYAERLKPFLENFADRSHGRVTSDELALRIMTKDQQVWVAGDFQAVCLTSVHPSHVQFDFCAGSDRGEWADDLEDEISRWAIALGKNRVIMMARPGWSKWAKGKGFAPAHIELVKELSNGR